MFRKQLWTNIGLVYDSRKRNTVKWKTNLMELNTASVNFNSFKKYRLFMETVLKLGLLMMVINANGSYVMQFGADVPFKYNNTHLMSKTKDIIDEALGAVELAKSEPKERKVIPRPQENDDIENDYKYQRENFYNLVERGTDAIDGILEIARESEHPRTYEVAGNLIKQVAEVTEKLGELQEKMKRLKEVPNNAPKNVTNALYVGSTAELQKLLKGKKNGQ